MLSLKPRITRLRLSLLEADQLVKVMAMNGSEYGGIVRDVDHDTHEVLVHYYDREVGCWRVAFWPMTSVKPMITGLTAAESRDIARTLLEMGRLPANAQTANAAVATSAA